MSKLLIDFFMDRYFCVLQEFDHPYVSSITPWYIVGLVVHFDPGI